MLNKPDYIRLAKEIASFTDEDWWEGRVPDGTPDTQQLTTEFIESGGVAWGFPIFEKVAFSLLQDWASLGRLIRVQMVARHWAETYPTDGDATTLAVLNQWASGDYVDLLNSTSCRWPGHATRYLYPINLNMIAIATEADEDMAMELRAEVNTQKIIAMR